MAKFSVGEVAEHIGEKDFHPGERVEIIAVGPFPPNTYVTGEVGCRPVTTQVDYHVRSLEDGGRAGVDESKLRKLPPDDTEELGLTRLKRVLEQDSKQVKAKPRVLS